MGSCVRCLVRCGIPLEFSAVRIFPFEAGGGLPLPLATAVSSPGVVQMRP